MRKFDEIETVMRDERREVLTKFSVRIAWLESRRPWLIAVGVAGAALAAFSRIDPNGTIGLIMAISGGLVAALSGLGVAVFDFKKLELATHLAEAENAVADALAEGRRVEEDLALVKSGATALDARRRERFMAMAEMLQAAEAGLLGKHSAAATAETMLRRSIASIRKATNYDAADFFTVTIFQRLPSGPDEEMIRVAVQWTDPHRAQLGRLSWQLGKGYTGVAWQKAQTNPNGDVIEADTSLPEIYEQYPVDARDAVHETLYKSVAAIPILAGSGNSVWGIVTATSDRPGMFTRDKSQIQVQNVEMIRDIARVAALLASLP